MAEVYINEDDYREGGQTLWDFIRLGVRHEVAEMWSRLTASERITEDAEDISHDHALKEEFNLAHSLGIALEYTRFLIFRARTKCEDADVGGRMEMDALRAYQEAKTKFE